MKITDVHYYDGARERVCRLGLADLYLQLQEIILSTRINLTEQRQANGAAVIREAIDAGFVAAGQWTKTASGGIDWVKRFRYNETLMARLGVEIQVSARSDMVIRDIVHIRKSLQDGVIDVGVMVLPNPRLSAFLTDRTPCISDAVQYIEQEFKEAMSSPIVLIGIEHDGPGPALPKRKTNVGREG